MPQYGMNIDPDNAAGLPIKPEDLRGMKWIRFVFQAQPHQRRTIQQSCQLYANLIDTYASLGIRTILILNHQTYVGDAPWEIGGGWREYAREFALVCGEIAGYLKGRDIAYEIWNEGDQASDSAIYVAPEDFAPVLLATSMVIKDADPSAIVVFGGLVSGRPHYYLRAVRDALGGKMPVDAIGVHPYGKGPAGANGIVPHLQQITDIFPDIPLWITEFGDGGIVRERYEVIEYYMRLVDDALRRSLSSVVPVAVWYCWSDGMNPGFGITDAKRQPKGKVYSTYFLLNKLGGGDLPIVKPPSTGDPVTPAPPPPTAEPADKFTHQDLINAIYEAAQAVGDNPWVWFRNAALIYLTSDRKKIYTGVKIADLPNLTTQQKQLIQRALNGESLETVNFDGADETDTEAPIDMTPPPVLPAAKTLDIQWISQFDAVGTPNNDCGDACVLMLLWYYRFSTPEPRIVFTRLWGKTVAEELIMLAKDYNLTLTTEPIAIERLPALIAANKPVIFLVDYKMLGFPVHLRSGVNQGNHWLIVVGYNETGFVVHDPLWMPAQRNGMGGAYLPIERETLRRAMIGYYVMLYRAD